MFACQRQIALIAAMTIGTWLVQAQASPPTEERRLDDLGGAICRETSGLRRAVDAAAEGPGRDFDTTQCLEGAVRMTHMLREQQRREKKSEATKDMTTRALAAWLSGRCASTIQCI
jgi:hypothetical protein